MTKRKIAVLTGLTLVLLPAIPGALVYNYVEHDPSFCTSCHLMTDPYERWAQSEHRSVECHDCHVSDTMGNLKRLYFSFVAPKTKIETHAEVDRAVCLSCHESSGGEKWRRVLRTRGHQFHVLRDEKVQCLDCHGGTIHHLTLDKNACSKCHADVKLHEQMGEVECTSCHAFLAPLSSGEGLRPTAGDCRRCHGKTPGTEAVAAKARFIPGDALHGELDCKLCHSPHQGGLSGRRSGTQCDRCHRGKLPPKGDPDGPHRDCSDCHQAHEVAGAPRDRCGDCHSDRVRSDAQIHKGRCETCHRPHEFTARDLKCGRCHVERGKHLAENAPEQHGDCDHCHDPHGLKQGSGGCQSCHARELRLVERSRSEKHRVCTSCHDPHSGKPAWDATCQSCHTQVVSRISRGIAPGHTRCSACHSAAHGPSRIDRGTCEKCHSAEVLATGTPKTPSKHRNCLSCHAPHGEDPSTRQATCASCHHAQVSPATEVHGGDCKNCHASHGMALPKESLCRGCHDTRIRPGRGGSRHSDCASCHRNHGPKLDPGTRCRQCHADEVAAASSWGAIEKHQQCSSCHPGHEPSELKKCTSCHRGKAGGSGDGAKDCVGCHASHRRGVLQEGTQATRCPR